ncbi:MAG: sigma-70 family RNA polymerase sigma factor [Kofleriaceae bacterium]
MNRDQLHHLMTAAADGDRAALEPLFRMLWPIITRYAERFVGGDAQDVAQDALTKLFGQLDRFDRERDALTWALTITTWTARTHRRSHHRRREDHVTVDRAIAPDLEDRDLIRAALATLDSLPERDRETILLAISDERPTTPTFRKRLERALSRLRLGWRSRHGTL